MPDWLVATTTRKPGVVEPRDRLEAAGDRPPLVRRLDELVAVVIDDAVAVEDDELDRRGSARRLRRRAGPWSRVTAVRPRASRCRRRGSSSARRRAAARAGWRASPGRRPSPSRRRRSGRRRAWRVASARSAPAKSPLRAVGRRHAASSCLERRVEVVLGAVGEPRAVDGRAPPRSPLLRRMLTMRLLAAASAPRFGQRLERLHGREPRRARGRSASGRAREHRLDLVRRVALRRAGSRAGARR